MCTLSLWPVSSHLHTIFSVVTVHAEEHVLFLQHLYVFYKQQRTLFTERVKPLLSDPFQSEITTFLLRSKAPARYHSLIYSFFFFYSIGDLWRSSAELQKYNQRNLVLHRGLASSLDLSAIFSGDIKCFDLDFSTLVFMFLNFQSQFRRVQLGLHWNAQFICRISILSVTHSLNWRVWNWWIPNISWITGSLAVYQKVWLSCVCVSCSRDDAVTFMCWQRLAGSPMCFVSQEKFDLHLCPSDGFSDKRRRWFSGSDFFFF